MRLLLLAMLAGACGSADIADGTILCSTGGECPPGFGCRDDGYCYRSGGGTGGPDGAGGGDGAGQDGPDASVDAAPDAPVDAPPVDCTDDTPCNPFDNQCADFYCDLADNLCKANPVNQGSTCMPRACPGFGACNGDGTCNENGTQSRTCQEYTCQGVNCTGGNVVEVVGCTIDTDGNGCGSDHCDPYPGGCPDDLTSECDQDGTRSRTCWAMRCGGGSCNDVVDHTETENCTRPTNGNPCGAVSTCPPGFDGSCDDCQEARTCTDYACSGGSCNGTGRVETRPCSTGAFCGTQDCGGGCIVDTCCSSAGTCTVGACGFGTCLAQCSCAAPPCP